MIDADCLIAGTLAPSGAASELLDLWQDGQFDLVVCPQLIHEVHKSLLHPRIARKYDIRSDEVKAFTARLSDEGVSIKDPEDPPRVVPNDPTDDYLIALSLESRADFLVTRDRHFENVRIKGIPIISPREMLRRLR